MEITIDERLMMLAKIQRLIWLKQLSWVTSGIWRKAKKADVLKHLEIQSYSKYIDSVIAGRIRYKSPKYTQVWNALNSL